MVLLLQKIDLQKWSTAYEKSADKSNFFAQIKKSKSSQQEKIDAIFVEVFKAQEKGLKGKEGKGEKEYYENCNKIRNALEDTLEKFSERCLEEKKDMIKSSIVCAPFLTPTKKENEGNYLKYTKDLLNKLSQSFEEPKNPQKAPEKRSWFSWFTDLPKTIRAWWNRESGVKNNKNEAQKNIVSNKSENFATPKTPPSQVKNSYIER